MRVGHTIGGARSPCSRPDVSSWRLLSNVSVYAKRPLYDESGTDRPDTTAVDGLGRNPPAASENDLRVPNGRESDSRVGATVQNS